MFVGVDAHSGSVCNSKMISVTIFLSVSLHEATSWCILMNDLLNAKLLVEKCAVLHWCMMLNSCSLSNLSIGNKKQLKINTEEQFVQPLLDNI